MLMRKITAILPQISHSDDSVRLDHDLRTRRRMVFTTMSGAPILLDLQRPARLRDGDGLQLEDGAIVRVDAAAEALIEIGAPSVAALVRIAWHLGNRHLPTQLLPGPDGGRLRIRQDHVIAEMVEGLGGVCELLMAPFDPEGGAYEGRDGEAILAGHSHHHHDHHSHGHHHHGHYHG
jgi:urease accessory protein